MTKLVPRGPLAAVADWLAQPEDARMELIDGELIEKAAPTFEHGRAQGHTVGALGGPFGRRAGGPGGPGGWWLATEVDILLDGRGYRPDIAGWRPMADRRRPRTPLILSPESLFRYQIVSAVKARALSGQPMDAAVRAVAAQIHLTPAGESTTVSVRSIYR